MTPSRAWNPWNCARNPETPPDGKVPQEGEELPREGDLPLESPPDSPPHEEIAAGPKEDPDAGGPREDPGEGPSRPSRQPPDQEQEGMPEQIRSAPGSEHMQTLPGLVTLPNFAADLPDVSCQDPPPRDQADSDGEQTPRKAFWSLGN